MLPFLVLLLAVVALAAHGVVASEAAVAMV
jgi:hypothetical protein